MQRQGEMLPANAYKSNHDAKLFGFTSARLDFDRWMWTEDKFNEIFSVPEPEPEPPSPEMEARLKSCEDRIEALERWAKGIAYGA